MSRFAMRGTLPVTPFIEPDLSRLRAVFNTNRASSGLTYEQLAERSGLHRQTLLNLASGSVKGDLRTWLLLSRAFEVPLDDLLTPVWDGQ